VPSISAKGGISAKTIDDLRLIRVRVGENKLGSFFVKSVVLFGYQFVACFFGSVGESKKGVRASKKMQEWAAFVMDEKCKSGQHLSPP
jgi:hypothetical protein